MMNYILYNLFYLADCTKAEKLSAAADAEKKKKA